MADEATGVEGATERWVSSLHNFSPDVDVPRHRVELHDITARDGEECADVSFTVEDKVRIAEALEMVGVRRMELFLTVPGWLETVRAIMRRNLQMKLYVTWHPGRVEKALDLGVKNVMVWYRIDDAIQWYALRRSRAELLQEAADQIQAARRAGADVNLFLPESTRATLPQIEETVRMARELGASAITIADSQGVARPAAIGFMVRKVREWSGLDVDVHCHNDFGLSTANVLAAYEAGAVGLNVSTNGLGYRAGNAPLAEVAMALEVLYDVRTGLKLEMLPWLSHLVEEISGIPIGYFRPVVGDGAFSYEQWGVWGALEAAGARPYAFPFEPEVVGRKPRIVVGKWSDLGAIEKRLAEFGLTASPEQVNSILVTCQRMGVAHHRPLTDDEFLAVALAEGACDGEAV
jgi:isopropylmalate/homocitrate/citramalate synthase